MKYEKNLLCNKNLLYSKEFFKTTTFKVCKKYQIKKYFLSVLSFLLISSGKNSTHKIMYFIVVNRTPNILEVLNKFFLLNY